MSECLGLGSFSRSLLPFQFKNRITHQCQEEWCSSDKGPVTFNILNNVDTELLCTKERTRTICLVTVAFMNFFLKSTSVRMINATVDKWVIFNFRFLDAATLWSISSILLDQKTVRWNTRKTILSKLNYPALEDNTTTIYWIDISHL